jgi:copper(I)-binding protein
MEIRRPFKEADRIPVKLMFDKTGEIAMQFHVGRLGGAALLDRKH